MMKILVFPCGSEIALEVHRALKNIRDIEMIGASSVDDHGKFIFEKYIGDVPFIDHPDFLEKIKIIVQEHAIDFVYPCMDSVLEILKKNEKYLESKVITSNSETCSICGSKKKTYDFLKDTLRVPEVYEKDNVKEFPVFSKPEIGASSRNTFKINDLDDLNYFSKKYPKNLILEYLPGKEYTVDCFTKKTGELIFVSSRERSRILNGISANTKIVDDPLIEEIAEKINEKIKFNGSWFFQLKKDKNNEYCLLEVAARFGGSSIIQRYRGINFPLLNIYNEMGHDVQISKNDFSVELDRSLDVKAKVKCEYDIVYVDFDDTLIVNNRVNEEMIGVLYKFLNLKKKVILITKHAKNIYTSLSDYKISESIFAEIIHLKKDDEKYKYMQKNAILIDDSYSERRKVQDNLRIPTFSPDTVNCFL